jgi:hypothetical protein
LGFLVKNPKVPKTCPSQIFGQRNYEEKLELQKHSRASSCAHELGPVPVPFFDSRNQAPEETDTRLCFVRSDNKASRKISWAPTETWTAKNNTASAEEATE